MTKVCHPARFSDPILAALSELIPDRSLVLDPFAGTGRIHELADHAREVHTIGIEIEPEWAHLHGDTLVGDATCLPLNWAGKFDVVATSPCYGNRFADSHNAQDGSTRRSYTHDLRAYTGDPARKLAPNNAGDMHWGDDYRALHRRAWAEVWRVLRPGGLFLLNVSDHYRAKERVLVCDWHHDTVADVGFVHVETLHIGTARMRMGDNRQRVEHEEVQVWRQPDRWDDIG